MLKIGCNNDNFDSEHDDATLVPISEISHEMRQSVAHHILWGTPARVKSLQMRDVEGTSQLML